ncbi:MAG: conjugal transfer protein TraD [Gammaproteobacteria bacterium]|nr:conjugal transfer protein TraD [Gammaproteobacteria bacterium]
MKNQERKEDTRRKIQLGGLVKKAGLENESTAVLYGMLLEGVENLLSDNAEIFRARWKVKGDIAFTREKK